MTAEVEDFERCPSCGMGLEPRVPHTDGVETVEEAIQAGDPAPAQVMMCPNPDCPSQSGREG